MCVLLVCSSVLHHGGALSILGVQVLLAAGGDGGDHLRTGLTPSSFALTLFTKLDSRIEAVLTFGTPECKLVVSKVLGTNITLSHLPHWQDHSEPS